MAPAPAPARQKPAARPSKVRYFKGKAPDAAPDSDDDSDEDEVLQAPEPVKVDRSLVAGGAGRVIPDGSALASQKSTGEVKVALRDVKIEGGRVVLPKSAKEGALTRWTSEAWELISEEESSEEEDESEEEEEEEEKPKPKFGLPAAPGDEVRQLWAVIGLTDSSQASMRRIQRKSRRKRKSLLSGQSLFESALTAAQMRPTAHSRDNRGVTQEKLAAEAEARLKAEEEAEEQRKVDSKVLAGETIRRELLERACLGLCFASRADV